MFATGGVEAGIREDQAFDGASSNNVGFDDFIDICQGNPAVPYRFGVNDDIGSVLTLIEAAGLVGANLAFQSALRQFLLERLLEFGFSGGIAAAARMALRALISANEDMLLKFRHEKNVQDSRAVRRRSD